MTYNVFGETLNLTQPATIVRTGKGKRGFV